MSNSRVYKQLLIIRLLLAIIFCSVFLLLLLYSNTDPAYAKAKEVKNDGSTCAVIKEDNSLWMWGINSCGQLGDGTTTDRYSPVKVMDDVKTVHPFGSCTFAIKKDDTLWGWGNNYYGALGDGTKTDRAYPVKILDNVKTVKSTGSNTMVIKKDNSLWMWGGNTKYLLGDGTTTDRYYPVKVMDDVRSADIDSMHVIALKSDKSLWTWGMLGEYDDGGELRGDSAGGGYILHSKKPMCILKNVKSYALSYNHNAAIKTDGSLWVWGYNEYDYVGYEGDSLKIYSPVKILANVNKVILRHANGGAAIGNDNSLWMWGYNIGDGTTTGKNHPVKITGNVKSVKTTSNNTMVIKNDNSLWGWGYNDFGQIGDETTIRRTSPVKITGNVKSINAPENGYYIIAVKNDSSIWLWGNNEHGQLGDGTNTNKSKPIRLFIPGMITSDCVSLAGRVVYTGKALTPLPKVKYEGITLDKYSGNYNTTHYEDGRVITVGPHYKVSYSNNKKIGTAKVTIEGINDFSGKVTKTFKIVPKKPQIKKLKTKKLGRSYGRYKGYSMISAKIKSKGKYTYQMAVFSSGKAVTDGISTKKLKKKAVTYSDFSYKWRKKNKTLNTLNMYKKLKKGKTYYVRIRTYKKIKGVYYYSPWSSAKKFKCK